MASMSIPDPELLRAFVEKGDETAFRELVDRRLDFVYAAALRQVAGDTHRAKDITQDVFIKLARAASTLSHHPALLGWLYTTTRFAAVDVIRSEQRRKVREGEHAAMQHHEGIGEMDWDCLQPVLDEALSELNDADREAVLARYFDHQTFGQIAHTSGVSENAAQKRVERALDKLHAALARRRITSTSAALGVVLANQVGTAAPAGLAAIITKAAVAEPLAAAVMTGWGLFTFMSTAKTLTVTGVFAVIGIGTGYLSTKAADRAEAALAFSARQEAALTAGLTEKEGRLQAVARRVQEAEEQNGKLLSAATQFRPGGTMLPAAAETPITSGLVSTRFKHAQELVQSGDPEAALKELLWCYDIGMPQISSMHAVRSSFAVGLLAKLSAQYPPALDAIRERRERARQLMLTDEKNPDAVTEFASINRALKQEAETVAVFDQLPTDDRRRRALASASYDYLVQSQRYADALVGRPYSSVSSLFETRIEERPLPLSMPNPEDVRRQTRISVIATAVKDIEMLAGAGEIAHARGLADRLLIYDGTDATRALIQKHAERAGQSGLLSPTDTR